MELVDVASFFDRVPARDPANGRLLFKCQVMAYDESKRDAYTAYRRIMSVKPGTAVPAAVSLYGSVWLTGDDQTDGWEDMHRTKYVLHKAAGQASIFRLSGFLTTTPETLLWGDAQWVKDTKELERSSLVPQKYVAILPANADVREGDVVVVGSTCILVGSTALHASGYMEALGMRQVGVAPSSVTVQTRVYVPSAGAYTNGAVATVAAMKVRWQELYAYDDQLAERYQENDCTFVLPSATVLNTSSEITHGSDKYTVMAMRTAYGCLLVHARLK